MHTTPHSCLFLPFHCHAEQAVQHCSQRVTAMQHPVPIVPEVRTQLYPHQVRAVRWMLCKEGVPIPQCDPAQAAQRGDPAYLSPDMLHHSAARAAARRVGGVLADDMGMGKTLTVLYAALAARAVNKEVWPTLVVTPKSLIHQWDAQLRRHVGGAAGVAHVHDGPVARQPLRIPKGCAFVLATYDTVRLAAAAATRRVPGEPHRVDPRGSLARVRFARVVLDEADCVRNGNTDNARAVVALQSRARWCLSGTPLNNGIEDVESLAAFIGVAPYSRKGYWADAAAAGPRGSIQGMQRWAAQFMLRRGEECLTLPPMHRRAVLCPLSPAERGLYNAICESALGDYEANGDGSVVLSAITRLRQMCVHSALALGDSAAAGVAQGNTASKARSRTYASGGGGKGKSLACRVPSVRKCPPSTRLAALLRYIHTQHDADPTARFIVFSQWRSALACVSAALCKDGVEHVQVDGSIASSRERAALVQQFTDGAAGGAADQNGTADGAAPTVILLALHCGSKGLDLSVANHVCILDGWYNPAVLSQAVKRAHRLGQQRAVTVSTFAAPNTIEDAVDEICSGKAELSKALLSAGTLRRGVKRPRGNAAGGGGAPPSSGASSCGSASEVHRAAVAQSSCGTLYEHVVGRKSKARRSGPM